MSTIEEIVSIERDAAAQLEAARKQADEIRTAAQDEAAQIVADARARRTEQEEQMRAELDQRLSKEDEQTQAEIARQSESRRATFEQHVDAAVDWVVERILGTGGQ